MSAEERERVRLWAALSKTQQRHVLLNMLKDTGAIVFRKDVAGHLVAMVMPGESEVLNQNEPAVWENLIDAIEEAKQAAIKLQGPRS